VSRQDDIDQLLEARYHHHAAGQEDQAVAATQQAVVQLRTWGQYGRAAELCRETLTWVTPGSQQDAMFRHCLGILAQDRGDYDAAEPLYRRSLEISERIGDQADMSASYHQLGILAQLRGDYDAAEPLYRRSLEIDERAGDQAGMSAGYHQLGWLAQLRGDYDAAEPLYRRSLEIKERVGDQEGMSACLQREVDPVLQLVRLEAASSERRGDCACRESRPWLWPAELLSLPSAAMITGHVPAVHVPPDHAASRVAAARPA